MVQTVKNPPAARETWVQSLGWEDPLEEDPLEWQPTLVFLIGESPWTEEPDGLQNGSHKESDMSEQLSIAYSNKMAEYEISFLPWGL